MPHASLLTSTTDNCTDGSASPNPRFMDLEGSFGVTKIRGATTEAFQAMPGSLYQVAGEQGDDLDNGTVQSVRVVNGRMPNLTTMRKYNRVDGPRESAAKRDGLLSRTHNVFSGPGTDANPPGSARVIGQLGGYAGALSMLFARDFPLSKQAELRAIMDPYATGLGKICAKLRTGNEPCEFVTEAKAKIDQDSSSTDDLRAVYDNFVTQDIIVRNGLNQLWNTKLNAKQKRQVQTMADNLRMDDGIAEAAISEMTKTLPQMTVADQADVAFEEDLAEYEQKAGNVNTAAELRQTALMLKGKIPKSDPPKKKEPNTMMIVLVGVLVVGVVALELARMRK